MHGVRGKGGGGSGKARLQEITEHNCMYTIHHDTVGNSEKFQQKGQGCLQVNVQAFSVVIQAREAMRIERLKNSLTEPHRSIHGSQFTKQCYSPSIPG